MRACFTTLLPLATRAITITLSGYGGDIIYLLMWKWNKSIHRRENRLLIELLRELRLKARLTQVEVARRLDRPQSYVSDVERGVRRIDVLELRDLCQVLGISLSAFARQLERALGRA